MTTRRIGILGYDDLQALDLVGPADVFMSDVFRDPSYGLKRPPYEVVLIGLTRKRFRASNGLEFVASHVVPRLNMKAASKTSSTPTRRSLASLRLDTLIVPGGSLLRDDAVASRAADWITSMAPRTRRIASVCTGLYALAPTGLVDGHRVTTHWAFADDVQRRFPRLTVDRDALYLKAGKCYTSAGVTAGIDLALAMVEEDLGPEVALAVARHLVVYLKRSGGQNQYSEPLKFQVAAADRFAELAAWIPEHLNDDLSVEALASHACLSVRQFTRVFKERFDLTPAAFVEEARLTEACKRLAARRANIALVARSVGYGSDDAFRRAFERRYGVSPSYYRRHFDTARPVFA